MGEPKQVNGITVYELSDDLQFGKFKGQELEGVIDDEPDYFEWVMSNVDWFYVSEQVWDYYLLVRKELFGVEQAAEERREYAEEAYSEKTKVVGW